MCYYCHQVSFTSDAWMRATQNPEDRFEAIRVPIENLGGIFRAAFFTTGNFDVLAITEFPNTVSPEAIAVAFADGGAVANILTTPLLTAAEMIELRKRAEIPVYASNRNKLAFTTIA
jgi:uncharacterized protein with GYD domain